MGEKKTAASKETKRKRNRRKKGGKKRAGLSQRVFSACLWSLFPPPSPYPSHVEAMCRRPVTCRCRVEWRELAREGRGRGRPGGPSILPKARKKHAISKTLRAPSEGSLWSPDTDSWLLIRHLTGKQIDNQKIKSVFVCATRPRFWWMQKRAPGGSSHSCQC